MDAGGDMRPDVAHHRALDRADIGQDRPRLQVLGNRCRNVAIGAERHAQHHQIGSPDCLGCRLVHPVDDAEPARRGARRLALGEAGNGAGQPAAAQRMGQRRADETDADQRHMIEQRLSWRGAHDGSRQKAASASTTSRFASSLPIDSRKACGIP